MPFYWLRKYDVTVLLTMNAPAIKIKVHYILFRTETGPGFGQNAPTQRRMLHDAISYFLGPIVLDRCASLIDRGCGASALHNNAHYSLCRLVCPDDSHRVNFIGPGGLLRYEETSAKVSSSCWTRNRPLVEFER